jgi:hypothetical protein
MPRGRWGGGGVSHGSFLLFLPLPFLLPPQPRVKERKKPPRTRACSGGRKHTHLFAASQPKPLRSSRHTAARSRARCREPILQRKKSVTSRFFLFVTSVTSPLYTFRLEGGKMAEERTLKIMSGAYIGCPVSRYGGQRPCQNRGSSARTATRANTPGRARWRRV